MPKTTKVTSKKLKNTGKIDTGNYEKFIEATAKQIKKSWNKFNPGENKTDAEFRKMAESQCSMYKHHFREYK